MLRAFGTKLAFIDAVFGMNSYGYPQLTVLVQDEFGNGVPVAFLVADTEDAATWQTGRGGAL